MSKDLISVVWMRDDLRLHSHPALEAGIASSEKVAPIVILSGSDRQKAWQCQSAKSSGFPIKDGTPERVLIEAAKELQAKKVIWPVGVTPDGVKLDKALQAACREAGMESILVCSNYLVNPATTLSQSNTPFKKFSAFSNFVKKGLQLSPGKGKGAPEKLHLMSSDKIKVPRFDFPNWNVGEAGARVRLKTFLDKECATYHLTRDDYTSIGTSMLSPHLRFGEISIHEVCHGLSGKSDLGSEKFLDEILWREYARYLFFHFPKIDKEPIDPKFSKFPWRKNEKLLKAWKEGKTGYPVIDAAMRELNKTGWMHNRLRMLVASFLSKHLLVHWLEGERYFADMLVDFDHANNLCGWQWSAGQGVDMAPYFRIFNPTTQSKKFDPEGVYIRKWVSELSDIDRKLIHAPEGANGYPEPIVKHEKAREEALATFKNL